MNFIILEKMNPAIKNITNYFIKTPRTLFLMDALGAAVTAFSLFIVLRNYYTCFGMPEYILTYLSIIALSFCMYFQELTTLGLSYFIIEILIILALVYVEWSVATAVRKLN